MLPLLRGGSSDDKNKSVAERMLLDTSTTFFSKLVSSGILQDDASKMNEFFATLFFAGPAEVVRRQCDLNWISIFRGQEFVSNNLP